MNRGVLIAVATLVLAVVACQERALAPTAARLPAVALTSPTSCPAHADFYVSDEGSLLLAIDSAQPGDTIALEGVIDLTVAPHDLPGVFVQKDGLTFTCATPGSGIRAEPQTVSWLFVLLGRDLRIEQLLLDGTYGVSGAVLSFNGAEGVNTGVVSNLQLVGDHFLCSGSHIEPCLAIRDHASGLPGVLISGNTFETDGGQPPVSLSGVIGGSFDGNTLTGGLGTGTSDATDLIDVTGFRYFGNTIDCIDVCIFADGSPGLTITANYFRSGGSTTGIQLQDVTDGDSVVGNTVVTTAPSFSPPLGGIRIRDGANIVVTDNSITGPWANSIAIMDIASPDVERNDASGAVNFGIGLGTGAVNDPVSVTGGLFRANQVTGAGVAGISVKFSCSNTFVGNDLQGNAGNIGLFLRQTSGANTYIGNPTVVVDNGAFDCNGDGINDPNHVSGIPRRGAVAADAGPQLAFPARPGGRLLK